MLHKYDGVSFQSSLILQFEGVIHGFSSRAAGDMGQGRENRKRFAHTLGLTKQVVFAEQVHGTRIGTTTKFSSDLIPGVDGLVSSALPVAIVSADCVPVLLVDAVSHVCAAVHSGWKGTLGNVVGHAVRSMVKAGAKAGAVHSVIGPHIGACCYDVPEDRITLFQDRFGQNEKMVHQIRDKWYLDLGLINYRQLIEAGVSPGHIDAPPVCTSCQHNDFFSFRRDTKQSFGKMMAVIGFGTI